MSEEKQIIDDLESKPIVTVSENGVFVPALVLKRIDNGPDKEPEFIPMIQMQVKVEDNPTMGWRTNSEECRNAALHCLIIAEACDRQRDTHEDEEYCKIIDQLRDAIKTKMYARKHHLKANGQPRDN